MKILTSNGTVEFADGRMYPSLDRATFLATTLGIASELQVSNGPYQTFRFSPEAGISATASFIHDQLRTIAVLMHMPSDAQQCWTEELEHVRKQVHDDWLHSELGEPPYCYAWGEITSNYDPKGCVSDIILSYALKPA